MTTTKGSDLVLQRRACGVSAVAIAERTGWSASKISRLEGKEAITEDEARAYLDALAVAALDVQRARHNAAQELIRRGQIVVSGQLAASGVV